MDASPAKYRNQALWDRILPDVVAWLYANPLASCVEAGKHFGLNDATLAGQLQLRYPGQFDFRKRRHARGEANRPQPKNPREPRKATNLRDEFALVLKEFDRVVEALGRIEKAILSDKPGQPD